MDELMEMKDAAPGLALQKIGVAFDKDYFEARMWVDNELCRIRLRGGETEPSQYVFNLELDKEPHFEITCVECKTTTHVKTKVVMKKLGLNSAGELQLSKTYGPYFYDYTCDETAYRYLMCYGNRDGYRFNDFGYIMPPSPNEQFDGTFRAPNITLTIPETADGLLLEDWLAPIQRDLPNLIINAQHPFFINTFAQRKLKTVKKLTINGRTEINLDFVKGFEGFYFHYNDPEGPMPLPIDEGFVNFFNTSPHMPGTRRFIFNVRLSEDDQKVIRWFAANFQEKDEAQHTGNFLTVTEKLQTKIIGWTATSLEITFKTPFSS